MVSSIDRQRQTEVPETEMAGLISIRELFLLRTVLLFSAFSSARLVSERILWEGSTDTGTRRFQGENLLQPH